MHHYRYVIGSSGVYIMRWEFGLLLPGLAFGQADLSLHRYGHWAIL